MITNNDINFNPTRNNKHYLNVNFGGLNKCPQVTDHGFVLPSDIAWVYGRSMEILELEKVNLKIGNAKQMFLYNKDGYKRGKTPKVGAIACWENSDGSTTHAGIVERINLDGSVYFSNSGNKLTYTRTLQEPYSYNGLLGEMKLLGFIYVDKEKDTNKIEEVKPEKSLDDLANEVLEGKWDSGVTRRNRINKAYKKGKINFNYDEVQNRVLELSNKK